MGSGHVELHGQGQGSGLGLEGERFHVVRGSPPVDGARPIGNVGGLHLLRVLAGTLLDEQGVDIHVIQRILGHTQLSTTRRYTHPTDGLTASAMDRMGDALWT